MADVAEHRGFSRTPRAVKSEHQAISTRITANTVCQALGKRGMAEKIVFRVDAGAISRKCGHLLPLNPSSRECFGLLQHRLHRCVLQIRRVASPLSVLAERVTG